MVYLIKLTLIWSVFLLLFEAMYRSSGRFTANRSYLLLSMLAGALLPLVKLPKIYGPGASVVRAINEGMVPRQNTAMQQANSPEATITFALFLKCLYIIGIVVLLVVSIREIATILRHAVYSQYQTVHGHKVFATEKNMAPYSFMGWIFISTKIPYQETELNYVLNHEAAHNYRMHWLDLLLMQAMCIVFWFHPLAWRFRYLLRLQHEYEADAIAAADDAYHYGHFLLQQTFLKGTPFIAHSFHFSPLKNRISMLTKMSAQKSIGWTYLMVIPALLACTLVMAKGSANKRSKGGNVATFNGNTFYFKDFAADTMVIEDPVTGKLNTVVSNRNPMVVKMNDEPVMEQSENGITQAQFRNNNLTFSEYLTERFKAVAKNIPPKLAQIQVNDVVINREGKIVYYELLYLSNGSLQPSTSDADLDPILDHIIADSPDWLPAVKSGKPVNVYLSHGGSIQLQTATIKFKTIGNPQKVVNGKGAMMYTIDTTNKVKSTITIPEPKTK